MLLIRRIIVGLIVSAIIWNSGGYFIYFRTLQAGIREGIERESGTIDEKDLVRVEIALKDASGIAWVKKDKEFICKGELYDVVKVERSDNSNIYYCIRDSKEKQLIADFDRSSGKDMGLDQIAKIIQKLTTPLSINQITTKHITLYIAGYLVFGNHYYIVSKGFTRVLTPPPDIFSHISKT